MDILIYFFIYSIFFFNKKYFIIPFQKKKDKIAILLIGILKMFGVYNYYRNQSTFK